MVNFPLAQNRCSPTNTSIHNENHIHCRSRPIVSLLQSIETVVQSCRMWCFVSQIVQPLTTPVTFSLLRLTVRKSHGDVASVAEAHVFRRHASLKKVWIAATSTCGAKQWNFSRFSSQVIPIVNDAIGMGIVVPPLGADTDTRSPESTHLMSKVSRGSLACSLITPMKMAWALFQGRFHRIKHESGPHMYPFEWKRTAS